MSTVKDLVKALMELPEDAEVVMEGCDCDGHWGGEIDAEYDTESAAVLLKR